MLIEIATFASMGGVTQAQAGLAGLGVTGIAAGAALVGLGIAAKSAMNIAEDHAKAELNLAQAVSTTKLNLGQQQAQLTTFMQTNRDYISNQADVINSYAQLIRTGLDQVQVQRVMNDALDLAALKGISYNEAVQALSNAEFGRMRGLIDLGITTTKYTDAQGNLILASHSVAQAMGEVDARVKDGRKSLTPLQTATNDLSNDWQDLANKVGPVLVDELAKVAKGLDNLLVSGQGASNDPFWSNLDQKLSDSAGAIRRWWLSQSEHGRAQLAMEDATAGYAGALVGPGTRRNLQASPINLGVTSYDAAAAEQALMDKTGQGSGPLVPTIGSTVVPPIVQSQLNAKLQAMTDAAALQAKMDRVITHLERVEANTGTTPRVNVAFTVQGMDGPDRQIAAALQKAMRT